MGDEAVGDLTGDTDHVRAEPTDVDGWWPERVGPGVEGGDHERVAVEVAFEAQAVAGLPAAPDLAHGEDDLAHALRRLRPHRAEPVHDVRPDLGAEAEEEA